MASEENKTSNRDPEVTDACDKKRTSSWVSIVTQTDITTVETGIENLKASGNADLCNADLCNLLRINGRGELRQEATRPQWSIDKWIRVLNLGQLDARTEIELEDWAEKAERNIRLYQPSARELIAAIEINQRTSEYSRAIYFATMCLDQIKYFEDLIDIFALERFPTDCFSNSVMKLMRTLFTLPKATTVLQADASIIRIGRMITYIAARREYDTMISNRLLRSCLVDMLPAQITQLYLIHHYEPTHTYQESYKHLHRIEYILRLYPASSTIENSNRKPSSACNRCGELHWRKDCPIRNPQCDKCGRLGHITKACRAKFQFRRDTSSEGSISS
eukprot:Gregarina_sp_Poly_1__3960@NODE_2192_length_2503_cov_211_458949_g1413_i0_p1_GENE_NODE_2192_length_2503_cov_211_458949_g1413_i0NODE_2192_length_2503_cov_211_458949_g1413_i0_p1_ORF_typecomplete_len334_score6_80zfCCHC_4/PF14392_6/35zfCCHC_4/PF14392_6/0_032zfCCHC_3/PF13917_6/1_2e02zfCCHC_3/PF13917_6/0_0062zfCCHC_5/PF14787_6/69zfCCHC_5/PF14787_6/0_011zfCCHC/PF00098_23/28zfCCHC/PF00098_23/2_7eIF3g/PF12353_8/0_53eIF3g/PF12353_8/6_7e02zfCCHC_6/PF15288_6/1_4e02zfCCHC_6/PF15288_6/3_1_NODE_2192_length_2503_